MGELPAFHLGGEAAVTAKQVIHRDEHQAWREHHQRRSAQGLQVDQVQVGWHRQVAGELMIRLNLDRTDADVRTASQQVKQRHTKMTGETLVNNLQRLKTLAHHATLGIRVVRTNVAFRPALTLFIYRAVTVAVEQRVNLSLGENAIAH